MKLHPIVPYKNILLILSKTEKWSLNSSDLNSVDYFPINDEYAKLVLIKSIQVKPWMNTEFTCTIKQRSLHKKIDCHFAEI